MRSILDHLERKAFILCIKEDEAEPEMKNLIINYSVRNRYVDFFIKKGIPIERGSIIYKSFYENIMQDGWFNISVFTYINETYRFCVIPDHANIKRVMCFGVTCT